MDCSSGYSGFSAAFLERRSETRMAADWPQNVLADPASRFIISRDTAHLVRHDPSTRIEFLDSTHPLVRSAAPDELTLLGWYRGAPCVSVALAADVPVTVAGATFEELRGLLPQLAPEEAGVLGCTRALLVWRARHRYCGVCGAPTRPTSAGHILTCTREGCGEHCFPRIDPAIIVLVTHGTQALLGRQASWPPGRYSTLAGFVEAGENLEDAVIREVAEETGVLVRTMRYFGAQPWPFPASLMVGFHAQAPLVAPVKRDQELEDARWFDAHELRAAPAGLLPAPHTIARQLIESWLDTEGTNDRVAALT